MREHYADNSDYVDDPQLIKKIRKCIGKGDTDRVDKCHTMYFRDDQASYYHAVSNLMMMLKSSSTVTYEYLIWEIEQPKTIVIRIRRYVTSEPNRVEVLYKENL